MKKKSITIVEATDGMWLTQASEVAERSFSKSLINPQEGTWFEWTDEQKTQYEAELEEKRRAQELEDMKKAYEQTPS